MADYATLKAAIQAVIYENGNQEITGSVMQATLLAMVNSLGANYQYAGIATPSTNPGTPDQNVFYLAGVAGTYVNFGNIVLAENEVAILKYNGSWTKEASGFASAEKVNQLDQEVVKFDDVKEDYSPKETNKYANLGSVSVGQVYSLVTSAATNYAYWLLPCNGGDIFILTTKVNTTNAKAYCILDGENKVLVFVQASQTNAKITIPAGGKTLIVNSRISSGDVYLVRNITGRLADATTVKDLDEKVQRIDDESVEKFGGFDIGSINYLTGVEASSLKSLRCAKIAVSQNFTLRLSFSRPVTTVYCIKYLGNTYAGYSSLALNGTLLYWDITKDATFDSVRIRADVTGTNLTTEEAGGASWGCFVTGSLAVSLDYLRLGLSGEVAGFKQYKIANSDNEFGFDYLGVLIARMSVLIFHPNFSVPTNGACLSTDVDYTGVRTSPITDEQAMRASAPYFYVNGEKRGTIVLFDVDGSPYIYDKNGIKRQIVLL